MYKGIAALELKEHNNAVGTFQRMQSTNFKDDATWYLALTLLKTNDIAECRAELTKIINGKVEATERRIQDAKRLVVQLDNLK